MNVLKRRVVSASRSDVPCNRPADVRRVPRPARNVQLPGRETDDASRTGKRHADRQRTDLPDPQRNRTRDDGDRHREDGEEPGGVAIRSDTQPVSGRRGDHPERHPQRAIPCKRGNDERTDGEGEVLVDRDRDDVQRDERNQPGAAGNG